MNNLKDPFKAFYSKILCLKDLGTSEGLYLDGVSMTLVLDHRSTEAKQRPQFPSAKAQGIGDYSVLLLSNPDSG